MLRNLISNRIIIGTLIFVSVIVISSLLYSWHVRRISEEALAQLVTLRQRENKNEPRTAADTIDISPVDFEHAETPLETEDALPIDEGVAAFTEDDLFIANDMLDLFIEATDGIDEVEEAPYGVSPFGFGPFPAAPSDYPNPGVWSEDRLRTMQPGHELISRVRIKLWNQGVRSLGGVYDNTYNLIYPILDDVVYIEWADNLDMNGNPYVRRQLTAPAIDDLYYEDIKRGIFPPHLTIYEFPDGGIDPYDFLGLPR